MRHRAEIKSGPHRWRASPLTTAPSLLYYSTITALPIWTSQREPNREFTVVADWSGAGGYSGREAWGYSYYCRRSNGSVSTWDTLFWKDRCIFWAGGKIKWIYENSVSRQGRSLSYLFSFDSRILTTSAVSCPCTSLHKMRHCHRTHHLKRKEAQDRKKKN